MISLSRPKRHHFVPQMILRRFADSDGWLHAYNNSGARGRIFRCRPEQLFVRKEYYTEIDVHGSKDSRMEMRLSKLENDVSPILERFIEAAETSRLPRLSTTEKMIWDKFVLLQYRRVPDIRDEGSRKLAFDEYDRITQELKDRLPHKATEVEAFQTDEEKIRNVNNAYIRMLDLAPSEPEKVLNKRGLILLRAANAKKFVIGSRPVIQMNMKNGRTLHDNFSEMWLPTSSSLAIGVGTEWEPEKILDLDSHWGMRYINEAIARNSSSFASASPRLTESIASIIS